MVPKLATICVLSGLGVKLKPSDNFTLFTHFKGALAFTNAHFGQGTGPIYLDDMRCNGNEASILDCPHDPNTGDCGHFEDSGVSCRVGGKHMYTNSHTHNATPGTWARSTDYASHCFKNMKLCWYTVEIDNFYSLHTSFWIQ